MNQMIQNTQTETNPDQGLTMQLDMTWTQAAKIIEMGILSDLEPEGRQIMINEIHTMARLLDQFIREHKALTETSAEPMPIKWHRKQTGNARLIEALKKRQYPVSMRTLERVSGLKASTIIVAICNLRKEGFNIVSKRSSIPNKTTYRLFTRKKHMGSFDA